jgi:hypothetical protein
MIWFGNLNRILAQPAAGAFGPAPEQVRMRRALEHVAEGAPWLYGPPLLDALAETGWVDRPTAERLLPHFRHFDPDRHFADHLRKLSFRGRNSLEEFRAGVRCVVEEITGDGVLGEVGEMPCVRFRTGEREGVVIAQPEVSFTITGRTRDAVLAAVEEMPDAVVVIARNFDRGAGEQLSGILHRTGVPGTLVTVNLLLGIRAGTMRYRPATDHIVDLLGLGRPLRSADLARLGERPVASPASA